MRAFIAIDFDRRLKERIAELQSKLKAVSTSGRWKYIDNFHLTLKFLDEIDFKTTAKINEELKKVAAQTKGFNLKISGLGSFPGKGCLRVLWMSLSGDLEKLYDLQSRIETGLRHVSGQGSQGESSCFLTETRTVPLSVENRGYTPHVTIGQEVFFKEDFDRLKTFFKEYSFPDIKVDRIYLFKSELVQGKRLYTPVSEFSFKIKRQ